MYGLVFILLLVECAFVALLVSPLSASVRRTIVRTVDQSSLTATLKTPAKYLVIVMLAAWVYALREAIHAQSRLDASIASAAEGLRHEANLYKAQRNVLLCGGAALLLLVSHRLFILLKDVNQLTATKEALAKQAEGVAAAFKLVSEERDELVNALGGKAEAAAAAAPKAETKKADAAPKATPAEGDAEDELARAKETISTLRERNSALLGEREAADKSVEALKKQATGLSTEYSRLQHQKESLENKLADYELVFGDQMKKAK